MGFATSALNAVVLLNIWELSGEQLGGINLLIGNAVVLAALMFKKGQEAG